MDIQMYICNTVELVVPVEQKKNASIGMTPISLYGEGKVMLSTMKAIPPFCMAVSREMAMIWQIENITTLIQYSVLTNLCPILSCQESKSCTKNVAKKTQKHARHLDTKNMKTQIHKL